MEMRSTITIKMLTESDIGEIACSVMFDGLRYESEPFNLQVLGKGLCVFIFLFSIKRIAF